MTDDSRDQVARDLAQKGIALIEAHERVCTERANEAAHWRVTAADTLRRIEHQFAEQVAEAKAAIVEAKSAVAVVAAAAKKSTDGIYTRLWIAIGGVVSLLLAIIFLLIGRMIQHP